MLLIGKARRRLGLINELAFVFCRTGLCGHSCQIILALSYVDHWYVFITEVRGGPQRLNCLPTFMWGVCGHTEE